MLRASEIVHINGDPNSPSLRAAIITTAAIDAVHFLPRGRLLVVSESRSRREMGCYVSGRNGACIEVSRFAPQPHFTFAHEFGHFIDQRVLNPYTGVFASGDDESFAELLNCWEASAEVVRLQKVRYRTGRTLSPADKTYLTESLRPKELFARTYAQWLANRSNHSILKEELNRRLSKPEIFSGVACSLQWESTSFKPIMDTVDMLFRSRGLL